MSPPSTSRFGRVPVPALGYKQGPRQMCSIVLTPADYVNQAGERIEWNPLLMTGTNRKEVKVHRKDIADYLTNTEDYIIDALTVYMDPEDSEFVRDEEAEDRAGAPGTLFYRPGSSFMVGNGGHRTGAYTDVCQTHRVIGDDVWRRMCSDGVPLTVILDADPVRRARDFVSLQNNAKPLNQSVAQSMNLADSLNRALIDQVIKPNLVPGFTRLEVGDRIEFLSDTPGKLSPKVFGYKAVRYASGLLLIGTDHRSTKGWAEQVEIAMARGEVPNAAATPVADIVAFWNGYFGLPDMAKAVRAEKGIELAREDTWLVSANLLYALAAAVNTLVGEGWGIAEVFDAMKGFKFGRTDAPLRNTLYEMRPTVKADGTTVDKPTIRTGRDSWEAASGVLITHARKNRLAAVPTG